MDLGLHDFYPWREFREPKGAAENSEWNLFWQARPATAGLRDRYPQKLWISLWKGCFAACRSSHSSLDCAELIKK